MRRRMRPALFLCLVAAVTLPAVADKAKDLYAKGVDAEARQHYEDAYNFFKQAYDQKPKDLRYRAAFERSRFEAAAEVVHNGQKMREEGRLDEAVAEFQKALSIDPSLDIAKQELNRTLKLVNDQRNPPPQAAGPPSGLERRVHDAAGPVELAPISNVPITVKITDKSDVVYRTIGQLAGINVLIDPDYTPRPIKVELNGVSLEEALEITALESKTFWRPVTSNTIFVAADNPAKRKELEQSVIKTFYLSNLSAPTELQDVVNAMRTILEVSRIQQLPSQNAIVVRGTPDQVALAEKLIGDIDKAKPEVVVDIAVMQVNREKVRTLGINPPTSATVSLQPNLNTNTTSTTNTTTGTTTGTTGTTGTPGSISLNALGNLNATDFQVNISSATATALYSDNDSRILQQPEIRAVDGQKASLKIGERVPVATGSFQPGIGGVGINPLVNTQFQYLDVGVNIDITPHVHSDGSVTLKVMMDVSNVAGNTNIGGIQQPIIGQRKIEHEIRLKEGEVNMLGGMFEHDDVRSLSGYPWLAQIPLLRYLFSQSNVDRRNSEIVFVLTPHVVRGQFVTPMNERVIDVGTANSIDLRQASEVVPAAPGQPAPAVPAPAAAPAQPAAPPSANPQAAGSATLSFDPATITQSVGKTFAVNVVLSQVQNLYSVPVQITYNPNMLEVVNVSDGNLLSRDGQPVALVHRDDPSSGTLQVTATRPPNSGGVSGGGQVFTITFMAKGSGTSTLNIARDGLRDSSMQPIQASGAQATITVQ